jgi:hypothetical protein
MRFRPTPPFYAAHLGEGSQSSCGDLYTEAEVRLYAAQFMNLSKGGISLGMEGHLGGSVQLPPLAQLYRRFPETIWRMDRLSRKV